MMEKLSQEEIEEFISQYPETENFVKDYPGYINQIISNAKRYFDVKGSDEFWEIKAEFRICLARISLLRNRDNGVITANVYIPENPYVAFEKENRDRFEKYPFGEKDAKYPARAELQDFLDGKTDSTQPLIMRFSAGGSITVLETLKSGVQEDSDNLEDDNNYEEFIVIGQRDGWAPIHKNYLALASGIAEKREDWENPKFIVATESVEEVGVRNRDGKRWYLPRFKNDKLHKRAREIAYRRNDWLENYEENEEWRNEIKNRPFEDDLNADYIPCPADIIETGIDIVNIEMKGVNDLTPCKGTIVIDPEFGALDLMSVVSYRINRPLSELRVLDGEGVRDRKTQEIKLLWRNIFVMRREEFINLVEGRKSKVEALFGRTFKDTPMENTGYDYVNQWYDGVPAELDAKPHMVPPLRGIAPAFLRERFGWEGKIFPEDEAKLPHLTLLDKDEKE